MISLIEVHNYLSLKYIRQEIGRFHVLVGPNGTGKTTFLDTTAFLGDLIASGLEYAVFERATDIKDLMWMRSAEQFEITVEAEIPEDKRNIISDPGFSHCRYEIAIGTKRDTMENAILTERFMFRKGNPRKVSEERLLFPVVRDDPKTIISKSGARGTRTIVHKVADGKDNFYDETGKGWDHAFKLSLGQSALAFVPDELRFPVSTWFRNLLKERVQRFVLNSRLIRKPSPPGIPRKLKPDGANLPWVIHSLQNEHPDLHREWIEHLKTALPDIENVYTIERPEDRQRYIKVRYRQGVDVPSWLVSDGTLRLMALTLLAYLPDLTGIYLIEEPENGLHPSAIETMYQSISDVRGAQVMIATHSPLIVSLAEAEQMLCFAKNDDGSTDVVRGDEHPHLRDWKHEVSLGELYAMGVLG